MCVTDRAESFEILTFSTCAQVFKNLGEGWSRLEIHRMNAHPNRKQSRKQRALKSQEVSSLVSRVAA